MSTAIDQLRPSGRRTVLAAVAAPPAADAGLPGGRRFRGGLVPLAAAAAVTRLALAVLLVLGAAVLGTLMMAAKLIAFVARTALLTWAIGRDGGVDGPWPWPGSGLWPPQPRR